jgi:hypothetical protein
MRASALGVICMIEDYGPRFLPFYKKGYRWQTIPSLLVLILVALVNSSGGPLWYLSTLIVGWFIYTVLWVLCYDLFMHDIMKLQVRKFYLSVFLSQFLFIVGCLAYAGLLNI